MQGYVGIVTDLKFGVKYFSLGNLIAVESGITSVGAWKSLRLGSRTEA